MAKRAHMKTAVVCGMTFQAATASAAKEYGIEAVTKLASEANIGPSLYPVETLRRIAKFAQKQAESDSDDAALWAQVASWAREHEKSLRPEEP